MRKNRYLPNSDVARATWLHTFNKKISAPPPSGGLPTMGEYLGLTAAEVAQIDADNNMVAFCIQNQDSFNNAKMMRTSYKDIALYGKGNKVMHPYPISPVITPPPPVPPGIFKRIPKLVARIKTSAKYDISTGKKLGIVGSTKVIDINSMQPVITLAITAKGVLIRWKKGVADGLEIFVDRGNGYHILATDMQPNYIDTHAKPATVSKWTYKAIYVINDEQVGQYSNEVSILVQSN